MRRESEIVTINYNELPNRFISYKLLDEIYMRTKPSLFDISRKIDKPVILYGAGNLGKMAKEYFDKIGITFLYVVDKNPEKYSNDLFWYDIDIFRSSDVPIQFKDRCLLVMCIVTEPYNIIMSQLKSEGWTDIIPFYDITLTYQNKHPLNNGWISSLLSEEDVGGTEFVITNLFDDISYAHYLQFIAWHSLHEEWIFKDAPIITKDKYFIPEIINILSENETFIDVGTYHGEFTKKFMNVVNNKFNSIRMIEPDYNNIDKLLNVMHNDMNNYNISLIPKALGKINGKKKFCDGLKCMSQISEIGNVEVKVYTLDDLNLTPSILKIHVEGTENDIFDGGLKTIKKNRPVIMMTVYHNRDGLWKTTTNAMKSLDDYVYYFRLHLWCGTCAVLYAIPMERLK